MSTPPTTNAHCTDGAHCTDDAPAPSSANAAGSLIGSVTARQPKQSACLAAEVARVADLLERETYARQCHHDHCPDVAYRKGHNAATTRAVRLLRAALATHEQLRFALHELAACDVDSGGEG